MPRVSSNQPNELRLHDNISNSTIVLYYRTPTAKEQAAYSNGMTKRVRNKLVNCTGEQRQGKGMDIFVGFREGDFLKAGTPDDPHWDAKHKGVRFSSDKKSPCYDPDWKKEVQKMAADLIERLAIHAFEMTAEQDDTPDLDDGSESE